MRIGGSGSTAPSYQLEVVGNADITGELSAASDMRLKEDIVEISDALTVVNELNPVSYKFKADEFPTMELPTRQKMGFLAQEVEEILPALVSTGHDVSDIHGTTFQSKSVNYIEMIPMLTKAIQEQQSLIEDLQKEVASLKKSVAQK